MNKKLPYALFVLLFVFFVVIALTAGSTYDTGDGVRHYLVSRYSWKHPALMLYSWGKPLFTLLGSPFAQFGMMGITVFNIGCGVFSAFICYRIALLLRLAYPWLATFFLCFMPCYFPTLNSGLTEPLFGLVLIASVYLVLLQRFTTAALLVSLLPYVRSEGYLLLPLFFIVLVYRKKYAQTLLMATGTLLYTVIGAFYYHDLFWLHTQNPYTGSNADMYGHGELFDFVLQYHPLFGTALSILLVLGCAALLARIFRRRETAVITTKNFNAEETFLIFGSFLVYFIAHSVMWWKGWAGSLGLLRVIAGIAPCGALMCLRGFGWLTDPLFARMRVAVFVVIPITLFFVLRSPFKQPFFPYRLNGESQTVKEAGDWFSKSPFYDKTVFYLNPYFALAMNRDAFDSVKTGELWSLYSDIKEYGYDALPDSTLIVWDAHFGPNECRIPPEKLFLDPHFEFVRSFRPAETFNVLGGYAFEINLFRKLKKPVTIGVLKQQMFSLDSSSFALSDTKALSREKAFSGTTSTILSATNEYGAVLSMPLDSIALPGLRQIVFRAKVCGPDADLRDARLVCSIDDADGKNRYWNGVHLQPEPIEGNSEWKAVSADYCISPDLLKQKATVKFYVWNPAKKTFLADDYELLFRGTKQ